MAAYVIFDEQKDLVVVELDGAEQARAWYDSSEYREAGRAREGAMVMKALIIEGV
jgi:uncharacterized protein (DUF1330 family)